MIWLAPNKYFYNFKLIFLQKNAFPLRFFRNKKVQATHEKYRGWNSSSVVFSCWADLSWPSAGIKPAHVMLLSLFL